MLTDTNAAAAARLPESYAVYGDHPVTGKTLKIADRDSQRAAIKLERPLKRAGFTNVHTCWVC